MDARGVFAACVLAGMGKGSMPSQYDIQNQVEALEDFVEYCDEKRFITAEQIARDFQWSLEKYLSEDEGDE